MSKYVIECPKCGRYTEASGGIFGLFGTKKINCQCGYIINVKTDRMTSKECPFCKNMVIYDQSKGESAKCPVCHELINTIEDKFNLTEIHCPSCSCRLSIYKGLSTYTCPLCDTQIDVEQQIQKEDLLAGGQTQVIKYEGEADCIVWKYPSENFNSGSQLIVYEGQEALFFKDGRALDVCGPGRHTLNSNQLPIAKQNGVLWNDEGQTFSSQVYFVNMTHQMAIKWGTSEKVTLIEPQSKAPMVIGARGLFNCCVTDSKKLVLKLVGAANGLFRQDLFGGGAETSESNIKNYFKTVIKTGVSSKLAEVITDNNIDILQIDREKLKLSQIMKEDLTPLFDDYGLKITEFLIEGIILPSEGELGYSTLQGLIKIRQSNIEKTILANDTEMKLTRMEADKSLSERSQQIDAELEKSRREAMAAKQETELLKAQLEAQKELTKTKAEVEAERLRMQLEMDRKLQTAQIEGEAMRLKGYTQKDVIQGEILKTYAENQSSMDGNIVSGLAGQALQIGAGIAAAKTVADMGAELVGQGINAGGGIAPASDTWDCTCGKKGLKGNFCDNCGNKRPLKQPETWDCECGQKGITGNFCSNCGNKRPAPAQPIRWNCECGNVEITGNFCDNCGKKREE